MILKIFSQKSGEKWHFLVQNTASLLQSLGYTIGF
jgi:hypothetical protein